MSLNVFVSVNGEGEGVLDGPDPADDPADDLGVEAEDVRDDAPGTTVSSPHRFHIFEDVDAEVDPGSHGQNPAVLTNAETNGVTVAIRGGDFGRGRCHYFGECQQCQCLLRSGRFV